MKKLQEGNQVSRNFRTDIQVLRGYAVLIVLFYHAQIGNFSYGFLGVDVFFVISGFLITSHVKKSIESNSFSFTEFYFRRAKRLLPAAYTTFFFTALLAPLFLGSSELKDFEAQMFGSVAFISNIILWLQSGYFDGASELKPLLHAWSLSIEEQYYFILPALMFFISNKYWKKSALFLCILSFVMCFVMVNFKPIATFYLLPTRGWELAIGSIGALFFTNGNPKKLINYLFWPCFASLIILPFFSFFEFHPGPEALIICISTLVIILRKHPVLFNGSLIKGISWMGDISYSLYLVHWPIFAFLNNAWMGGDKENIPLIYRFSLLFLSLFLAWTLNRFIEEPARKLNIELSYKVVSRTFAASLLLIITPFTITKAVATDEDFSYIRRPNYGFGKDCEFKNKNFSPIAECRNSEKPKILVWGDSYAMHLVPGLLSSERGSPEIIQATRSECGPFLGIAPFQKSSKIYTSSWAKSCIDFNDSVIEYLSQSESVETVVMSSPFSIPLNREWDLLKKDYIKNEYHNIKTGLNISEIAMKQTIDTLRSLGKKAVVISPPPSGGFNVGLCLERIKNDLVVFGAQENCIIKSETRNNLQSNTLDFLDSLPEKVDVQVIDLGEFLCDSEVCKTSIDGEFIYRDGGHLSYDGSRLLANRMDWVKRISQEAK